MSLEVMQFSIVMEKKLIKNSHKSGWQSLSRKQILRRIEQEVGELRTAIDMGSKVAIIDECADVANFCMMMHDNLTRGI
jgi:hypothetical protein